MSVAERVSACADDAVARALDDEGFAVTAPILSPEECATLAASFEDGALFRKTVVMDRHNFGRGTYRYFADPLPPLVRELRASFYARLVPVADGWNERLGIAERYPATLDGFVARSVAAGQSLPTPLLLRYGARDYNCLHQHLYGEVRFPLQLAILLDEPGRDFEGGEFVLVEQRPRMQSRPMVVPLTLGRAVIFPCHTRPRLGARGFHRTVMRHGVSEVRAGRRHVLGILFHGAAS